MKAPPFTAENAASNGRIGGLAAAQTRKRARLERLAILQAAKTSEPISDDEARRKRTLRQINCLDKLIDKALERDDEERFLRLCAAKERLWKLVSPTAGVLKQGRQSRASRVQEPDPQPITVIKPVEPVKPAYWSEY